MRLSNSKHHFNDKVGCFRVNGGGLGAVCACGFALRKGRADEAEARAAIDDHCLRAVLAERDAAEDRAERNSR